MTGDVTEAITERADDPADAARILEERARQLARRPEAPGTGERVELLGFTLGGSRLAIESRFVVAVVRDVVPTPLPGALPPVAAVVAWRGRVMTVLELHTVLAATGGTSSRERPHMLVLGETAPELGMLVDDVDTLVTIEVAALHPVPEGTAVRAEYLRAMAPDTVPVLDAAAILRLHAADA